MNPGADTASAELMRMLHAPLLTQALAVAAELGLADLVADRPCTAEELAAAVDAHPEGLYRMLRALAGAGVFREVAPRTFGSTPLAEALREVADGSLRHWARLWGLPQRHAAIGALLYSVRTGEPSFPHLHGRDWWSHLAEHPEQAAVFDAAMGDLARQLHAATVRAYDLSAVRWLVDIGGGRGHLVSVLLGRYPELRATVFDRPEVVPHAAAVLAEAGVADRAQLVGGDFFQAVPPGADAYLMSMILHDWNDAQVLSILEVVRRAMGGRGELLVVDAVVPPGDAMHDGKLRDLIMLTLHPGRERTEAEFSALFARAGLRLREVRELAASTSLLVAVPA